MTRKNILSVWLKKIYKNENFTLEFASADADFRQYFRAKFKNGKTIICMDAPPDKVNISPFIQKQKIFSCVHVPKIFAYDKKLGFMALEDLGEETFLDVMLKNNDLNYHKSLLLKAINTLIKIQLSSKKNVLPSYDGNLLLNEIELFKQWYVKKKLNYNFNQSQTNTWNNTCKYLISEILKHKNVYVHRDFIVRNIINRKNEQPGVLDFQDAVFGSIYYDILSLTKDAFIEWEEDFILDILIKYWESAKKMNLPIDERFDNFYKNYQIIGLQRHLKIVGIFSRLAIRDNKPKYLNEIPRFINYINTTCLRYKQFHPLYNLIQNLISNNG